MTRNRYRIVLDKEDFKFSAAHFTVFSAEQAEPLHGHNYRVGVEVAGDALDELGFLVEFHELKGAIRGICSRFDEVTLVPTANPHLRVDAGEDAVDVEFADRRYRLPRSDVLLLDIENSTVEAFAREIWKELAALLDPERVDWLAVAVGETPGQCCRYEGSIGEGRE